MDDSFKEELLPEFILESREHLDAVEPGLLEIEEHLGDKAPEAINEVFRAIHSLKGTASYFGFKKITSLAHVMENLLMLARDGDIVLHQQQIDLLISGTDKLRLMIENIEGSEEVDTSVEVEGLREYLDPAFDLPILPEETPEAPSSPVLANENDSDPEILRLRKLAGGGHFFYRISYSLSRHIYGQRTTPKEICGVLASIGTVLDCDQAMDKLPPPGDPRADDCLIEVTLATVLQPDYLSEGLDLEAGQIKTLTLENLLEAHGTAKQGPSRDTEEPTSPLETEASVQPSSRPGVVSPDVVETLRVPVPVLNKLMDLAGELVLNRNQLKLLTERLAAHNLGLGPLMQSLDLVTTDLQTTIMNVRLQPVGVLFNRFPRVVRDLGRQLGKELELVTQGNEVDLDKSILEALSDPLTHLVRNCADHGIESPHDRMEQGKPRQGTITLRAYHRNEQIHIDISDDGKGIDPRVIAQRVVDKGLLPAAEVKMMSPQETARLIFLPGFTTVNEITEVSGRGVGMDVVKTNIERLGGSVDLSSIPGEGSTITLKLPLTLAIIPAQIVEVASVRYAIPQVNLEEMVQVGGNRGKYRIEDINGREVLLLRGELLPLVNLRALLRSDPRQSPSNQVVPLDQAADDTADSPRPRGGEKKKKSILVLSAGDTRFGLIVDELLDREEVVVKPLSSYVKVCRFYAGATILGDGRVAMILDVTGLAETACLEFSPAHADPARTSARDADRETAVAAPFLVFEGGAGQFFGLPLPLVARVDKVRTEELVHLDGKTFFRYQNSLIQMIWLHQHTKAAPPPPHLGLVNVIVPRMVTHPIGIGAISIHDIVETRADLNCRDHPDRGVIGSAILEDKPVLFLDLIEIFESVAPEIYAARPEDASGMAPGQVLVVESNPVYRALLSNYFRSVGWEPSTASTGMEAFQKLQAGQYRLVLLAEKLPVMNTPALISRVRSLENGAGIRFIGLTEGTARPKVADETEVFESHLSRFDKGAVLAAVRAAGCVAEAVAV